MGAKRVGTVVDMSFHRNGSSGNPFWTILFAGHKDSPDLAGRTFVATYFEDEGNTAVLELAPLIRGEANHCMRGDVFHNELKELAENFDWTKDAHTSNSHEEPNRRGAIAHTKAKAKLKP